MARVMTGTPLRRASEAGADPKLVIALAPRNEAKRVVATCSLFLDQDSAAHRFFRLGRPKIQETAAMVIRESRPLMDAPTGITESVQLAASARTDPVPACPSRA